MSASPPFVPDRVAGLAPFVAAGVFDAADVHVAAALAGAVPGLADAVVLAAALAVRATRTSHVCVVLADVPHGLVVADRTETVDGTDRVDGDGPAPALADPAADPAARPTLDDLPWPAADAWDAALRSSPAVAVVDPSSGEPRAGVIDGVVRPLVYDGARVYLERYWRFERAVGDDLLHRAATVDPTPVDPTVVALLDALFPAGGAGRSGPDRQRQAAEAALRRMLVVVAGGPGTGKTHTVARVLAALHAQAEATGRPPAIALAAPTGKAADRMTEAVRDAIASAPLPPDLADAMRQAEATTLHRLLGWLPGTEFRHHRGNPLSADVVVVDEASMVPLALMARLLAAVRPDARLVLVGDPFQLASIDAGTVLADVVGVGRTAPAAPPTPTSGASLAAAADALDATSEPLAGCVTRLERVHRFGADSGIALLADAVRSGDADAALAVLRSGRGDVGWVDPADGPAVDALGRAVAAAATVMVRAALDGDAVAGLAAASAVKVLAATHRRAFGTDDWRRRIEAGVAAAEPRLRLARRWYPGRPVLVTRNDYSNRLTNGTTGLVVALPQGTAVAFPDASSEGGVRLLQPSQIADVETWWAMTIHKSQGSEFDHAVVSLPVHQSPLLTRELLYTGVTRARHRITLVGSEAAVRAAIARPVTRASGLGARLWPD